MTEFKTTTLWKSAFSSENDQCKKLEVAFDYFRERAETLANEIISDQPTFTVHDITHIDALWTIGSLIVGDDFKMTPTEGFILGGAFLVHDIAMSLSAYPKGINELKILPQWNDTIYAILKRHKGCDYSEVDIIDINSSVEEEAKRILLRELHALKAKQLCNEKWSINGSDYYLIDNPELRESFGSTIGEIAASHWWSAEDVKKKLNTSLGAPATFPPTWTVDKLKLACIIRLADYCQIDETRAPSFLMGLRKPDGIAMQHWQFQNKLLQPFIENGKLVYTSKSPFQKEESSSWWLCYDTLKSIDTEIRKTNAIVKESHKDFLFQVEGVLNVDSPARLAEKIQTDKWLPIDATIQVTNVAHLAKTLGGRRLYGDDKTVPIRELIQNASDAVRARRIFENKADNWGEIIIREGKEKESFWIEIEDNGIGMSEEVIKGPFLDFGTSYWGSELMLKEFPGLISKGFSATGRYGIGFFSVFMICSKVEITTLRVGLARIKTLILEFGEGLDARPILRHAENTEVLDIGGTKIRMWLKPGIVKEDGNFEFERFEQPMKIKRMVEWLCPSLDVSIKYDNNKKITSIIKANDWLTISGEKLLKRISRDYDRYEKYPSQEQLKSELKNLKLLKDQNKIVGRACFLNQRRTNRNQVEEGIITIGGFRANELRNYKKYLFFGILLGKPFSAVRNIGVPLVKHEELSKWATEQGELWNPENKKENHYREHPGSIICQFGGNSGNKSIGKISKGKLSLETISNWKSFPDEILIVDDDYNFHNEIEKVKLLSNVFVFPKSRFTENFLETDDYANRVTWPSFPKIKLTSKIEVPENSIYYWVLKKIAEKWGVTILDIIKVSDFSEKKYVIGKKGTKEVKMIADLIRKPKAK